MDSSLENREQWAQRARILEALSSAIARRNEVMGVVSSADSPEAARRALIELLATDEVGARAILELQLRRFTLSTRSQIEAELSEHRKQLSAWELER